MHFKEIARQVTSPGDTLYVAVATLGTAARRTAFKQAIERVCEQTAPRLREVVVAHWDSASSWGLQVADYGLWAVQRHIERGMTSTWLRYSPPWRQSSCLLAGRSDGKIETGVLSPATSSTVHDDGCRQAPVRSILSNA
jgi:hypothetical protein